MNYKTFIKAASVLALTTAALVSATAANASPLVAPNDKGGSDSKTYQSKECESAWAAKAKQMNISPAGEACLVSVTTSVSDARTVSASALGKAKATLSPSEFQALATAVSAGTVKSKSFRQQSIHAASSLTQWGTFYYDGNRVWVTTPYRGFTGSHFCQVDYVVAFSIQPQNCYDTGSNTSRTIVQQWLVTPFLDGFPLSWNESYSIDVLADGTVRY
jgi:hypothetical protein